MLDRIDTWIILAVLFGLLSRRFVFQNSVPGTEEQESAIGT